MEMVMFFCFLENEDGYGDCSFPIPSLLSAQFSVFETLYLFPTEKKFILQEYGRRELEKNCTISTVFYILFELRLASLFLPYSLQLWMNRVDICNKLLYCSNCVCFFLHIVALRHTFHIYVSNMESSKEIVR